MRQSDGPLTDDELETWGAFATVLEWLPTALDAQQQRDSGLTHFEYGILFALAHAEADVLRMSVLAGYANSTLSRLSRAVTRLERRAWVTRTLDPSDGRFTLVTLTPAGRRHYQRASPGHAAVVRRLVLDQLSRPERQQLGEVSRRIAAAVRAETDPLVRPGSVG